MTGTRTLMRRLEHTAGLPELLAAAWDAFDFIAQTAAGYGDPNGSARGYAFMLAAAAACRGRNAVACAPSLPDAVTVGSGDAGPVPDGETQTAAALADLSAVLRNRLAEAGAAAPAQADRQACEAAVAAAAATCSLLAADDGG